MAEPMGPIFTDDNEFAVHELGRLGYDVKTGNCGGRVSLHVKPFWVSMPRGSRRGILSGYFPGGC
jgi:hypothetical protein